MHHGCVRSRQRRREGAAGWWPTSPSSRWAGRTTTPASWPPTTNSTCPATVSPQAGGTAPAPPRWGCRAKHRRPGSRPCSRAATRQLASCWAVPTAVTPCPPLMWSCGRPRASRSSTASVIRRPAGRCWPPTMLGWPRRSPTWTSTWGPAAAMAVSSTCPDRGCWRSASTTGHPEKAIRCCIPTWSSPTASRDRTDAGQPWTAGTCTGIAWPRTPSTGLPTSANSSGHWGWSGRRRTPTATGSWPGCLRSWCADSPSAPTRSRPSWTDWSRMVGSGRRGWSSGRSRPPANPRSTRHRTPCTTGGGRRRPSAGWTRTSSSGR